MKDFLKILAVVAVSLIAGAYLHKCQNPKQAEPREPPGYVERDTIPYIDTIPYLLPTEKKEISLGTQITFLPVFIPQDSTALSNTPIYADVGERDSIAVEIPITQREYESEDYHAWVSGYDPKLDSIFVFARREVVTIREPPNRKKWHIGPTIGYGYTPQGFQPYIGLSVTYSILSF